MTGITDPKAAGRIVIPESIILNAGDDGEQLCTYTLMQTYMYELFTINHVLYIHTYTVLGV